MNEQKVETKLNPEIKISRNLDDNIRNIKEMMTNSADLIVKNGMIGQNKIAVLTCEGMASTDTLAMLIYSPLNTIGNNSAIEPERLGAMIYDEILAAAEQIEIENLGSLCFKLVSGFAIILINGTDRCTAIGIQGYKTRGIDEPSTSVNARGSREGFVEAVRTNMSMVRRRIKSPTLTFKMIKMGDRSYTDVTLCYLTDKTDKKLLAQIEKNLSSVKLNTILESGYIQPFLESKGSYFYSEVGICERPDSFAAKLYEGRVGILVDGTPFALIVPFLFIENFQTLDDYTQKPFYATFLRWVRFTAYMITLFLPGLYVAIATFNPELLPSSLLLNLAAAEQTTPYSLLVECLIIHFMYEVMREAGLRLPRPVGHAVGIVGGLVVGDITVSAGLIGAPMVLIVALSGICSFVVPDLYEKVVILRFIYIVMGGLLGLFGIGLVFTFVLIKMCSLNSYGIPYMSPLSPFTATAMRDVPIRASWRFMQKNDVKLQQMHGTEK